MKNIKSTFFLLLAVITLSCSSDSDEASSDTVAQSSDYLYFISGKIDGVPFIYGQREDATELDYSILHSGASTVVCAYYPDTGGVNYYSGVYPNFDDESRPSMGIEFVKFFLCTEVNDYSQSQVFNDRFPVGTYELASSNSESNGTVGGIGFDYAANSQNGPFYDSYGNQTGSFIEITSSESANSTLLGQLIGVSQIVEGNFSIKLYNDENDSDVIEITDGRFKMRPQL